MSQTHQTAVVVNWQQSASEIAQIVGLSPNGAAARISGLGMDLTKVRCGGTMSSYPPGTITRRDDEVWVQTGRGHLVIERVAIETATEAEGHERDAMGVFEKLGVMPGDTFDPLATAQREDLPFRKFNHAA